ncbi:MAG: glutamine ABC transporter ATP-binding protein GlnQ, partial [Rhodobacterales bacterium]
LDAVRKLASEGMTMIIVSHEMGFVREVANKVIFMDHGEIIESGTPQELFEAPKTDRARNFFSKILRH